MENERRSASKLPDHPAFVSPPETHPVGRFFAGLFAVLVIAGAGYTVYTFEHKRVTDLTANEKDLQSQVISLQNQVTAAQATKAGEN